MSRKSYLALLLSLSGFLLVPTVWGIDPHTLIPANANLVIQIQANGILDAPLVDRNKPITLRQLIVRDHKDPVVLGVRPLKNITSALIALPTLGDVKKIFAVIEGNFEAELIRQALADQFGDMVKVNGSGPETYYSVPIPERRIQGITTPGTLFLAIPDPKVLLVALGDEESMIAALNRKAAGTPAALRKMMEGSARDLAITFVFASQLGGPLTERKDARRAFELFQTGGGGVRIDEEGLGQFTLSCRDEKSARELEDLIRKGLNLLTGGIALLSQANSDLKPILDIIRTCRVIGRNQQVTVKGKMERELIQELIQKKK